MAELGTGLALALHPANLAWILAGAGLGVFAGAMPGLSSTVGLALVLPVTFALDAVPALLMMTSLYMSAQYGGSITAIAIGVPGSSPALATTFDGYPMSRRGEAARALGISLCASAVGGVAGATLLLVALAPLARVALEFGPAEFFSLGVFGLSVVATLVGRDVVRGVVSAVLGLLLFVVGLDVMTGAPRLTFGATALLDGFALVPMLIGFFAITEALEAMGGRAGPRAAGGIGGRGMRPRELPGLWRPMLRGSAIGGLIGAIPGAGATIASIVAWNEERRASATPERFGEGAPEGVAAPEAANNACVGAAMIPLLSLGIPGSASAAVLLGGLRAHGLSPGPLLPGEHPAVVAAIQVGFFVSVAAMVVVGLAGIPLWSRVVRLPQSTLMPLVVGIAMVGTYASRGNPFDAWSALGFGVLGLLMKRGGFPLVPAVLGLILGSMIETNYRRALSLSDGSHWTFVTRPISLVLLILAAASFASPMLRRRFRDRRGDAR